jgi:L-alanine-DL-glutamate epimerase-like enolase superfamily enzyme
MDRRDFIKTGVSAGMVTSFVPFSCAKKYSTAANEQFNTVLNSPALDISLFKEPVILEDIQLFKNNKNFFVQVIAKNGAMGYAVSHPAKMPYLYPILLRQIFPVLRGQDARDWENLLEKIYLYDSNYKMQGQAFWIPLASLEFAVLDLLGNIANRPVGELFGGIKRRDIPVYQANNHRGKSAEESADLIKRSVEETGAKAVKYKIGGRMSKNKDYPPGRTEKLIPLVRKLLGEQITIYADSNGSYDVPEAIRIGKMLEETRVSFYEEPCPFDYYEETKAVADALVIPIAGGEQESSLQRFNWMIQSDCLQVVQPDLFYFGGFVRSIKVAKMASLAGIPCTPHISGGGLGYLYMLHFASCLEDPGPFQEFKGGSNVPFSCSTSTLESENGTVKVPSGPGWGIELEKEFIQKATVVTT